jgi:hypothetical protein
MKRMVIFLSAILFGSMIATAQSADPRPSASPAQQTVASALNGGCPVSMRAQQESNPGLMTTRGGASGASAQRIHLTVGGGTDSSSSARIFSVKITVHGTSSKARVWPVSAAQPGLPDAAMTFDLRADGTNTSNGINAAAVSSDLLLRGFTSVQSVTLESVAYADGSGWIASAGSTCSVAPEGLMRVSH